MSMPILTWRTELYRFLLEYLKQNLEPSITVIGREPNWTRWTKYPVLFIVPDRATNEPAVNNTRRYLIYFDIVLMDRVLQEKEVDAKEQLFEYVDQITGVVDWRVFSIEADGHTYAARGKIVQEDYSYYPVAEQGYIITGIRLSYEVDFVLIA